MTQIKFQTNGTLVFEAKGFTGGRNNCQGGSGFVRIEFAGENEHGEFPITILDNLSCVDGEYSPVDLTRQHLEHLGLWIQRQLEQTK